MTQTLGLALALACALTTNFGFLCKQRGASAAPAVDCRRPLWSAKQLFASRLFTIGMLIATGAWVFHIAAMALAPLSMVQVVLASGVVLLAVMAERVLGVAVGLRQWLGLLLTAAGLMLLGISLPAAHGAQSHFSVGGILGFEGALLGVGALLIVGPRIGAGADHHGAMLAGAAGTMFGVSDVALKALTGVFGAHGVLGLVSPWLAIAVLGSIVGFYTSAKSLQDGEPVAVIAVTATATNVSGILGGLLVFGDPFPSSIVGVVTGVLAFVMVLIAAWLTPGPGRAPALAA